MQPMSRSNKVLTISLAVVGAIALIGLTIWGAIWVSHSETRKAESAYPKCAGTHAVHKVVIRDDKVIPQHTVADRCDTLTITNLDTRDRIIAFGEHDHHTAYDGVTERYVPQDGKVTVTLIQPGNFRFHDHVQDEVEGTFTVNKD
jgi:hypothetical protein